MHGKSSQHYLPHSRCSISINFISDFKNLKALLIILREKNDLQSLENYTRSGEVSFKRNCAVIGELSVSLPTQSW